MSANRLNIVFGGALFREAAETSSWLTLLEKHDIKTIDTATIYGDSEKLLGDAGAASKFVIDTKHPGAFRPVPATKNNVISVLNTSLELLKADSFDVYYIHSPDRKTPFKETLEGLDELYKQGKFKRLGISNFLAHEVEEMVQVAKENNFVVPSVYQGNYNAVGRLIEDDIFPVLRKHNMSFYAYSPIAGGFLAKTKEQLFGEGSRFLRKDGIGKIYNGMYNKPSFVEALAIWGSIATGENITPAELAYRWIFYHSQLKAELGDAVIIGASREKQLSDTLVAIERGPLKDASVKKIEEMWGSVKADANLDNFAMIYGTTA
ncbi:Aflatoxin B1 aldehyde reductase member 4 [Escovopsis weberi]|uniref:Aflatoxin B1 aldehyde reductase member 4 n=1 Tax=Escovopsis weberi TaxID=150374 RepID=A0A0M8MTH7_ESCWE|nr:Aflatoxin B1 aldehyde reductase member 4 [Escovopsis weberi]